MLHRVYLTMIPYSSIFLQGTPKIVPGSRTGSRAVCPNFLSPRSFSGKCPKPLFLSCLDKPEKITLSCSVYNVTLQVPVISGKEIMTFKKLSISVSFAVFALYAALILVAFLFLRRRRLPRYPSFVADPVFYQAEPFHRHCFNHHCRYRGNPFGICPVAIPILRQAAHRYDA